MSLSTIDRLIFLALVCAIVLHTFWQRPSESASAPTIQYIPGKADTTILNVHVDFPEMKFPAPVFSIPAKEDPAAGIVRQNCDSVRFYRQEFSDSSGAKATVEDTVHGKILWRRVSMDFNNLTISKTDTIKITTPAPSGAKWSAGPYVSMQLDTGSVVRMRFGCMYSGKAGAWTATYAPGRKTFEIGRAFYLVGSRK